ncbi:MAG: transposase [Akkermansiaceae bacterium]|nr:transposase [Akkermansiaceae bacterium]MCF7733203.1 transposase [Akkermansiaceae bacterium]
MNFLNPHSQISKHGEELPHWQQGSAIQFVTFRLGDALPLSLIREWRSERTQWMAENPQPWSAEIQAEYHRRFTARIEHWLDQGLGCCHFADPEARRVLADSLMRFEGERVRHQAWVIMPNHVHLLFSPLVEMGKLIQSWKGHTARLLGKGPIWQPDYRDTLIRDRDHFVNVLRYIRRNPIKAKLSEGRFTLWERSGDHPSAP